MKLSAASLAKAKPGDILNDEEVRGLHVRVGERRTRFLLYYRTKDGTPRRPKLGDVQTITLTQARALARKMLADIALGGDPSGATAEVKASPTFGEFAEEYMRRHANENKKRSSAVKDQYLLDSVLLPRWRNRKIGGITGDDIAALREEMANTKYHFNRVRSLVSKMFSLAEAPGWRYRAPHTNPVKGVARYPEKGRRRYMRVDEAIAIAKLLDEAESESPASVAFIRLCILVGTRPGEIATARWEWMDGAVLRHPEVKTGERDIYFSPAAMAVLESLPRTNGTLTGIKSPTKLWQRIRRDAGCPDLRLQDLRRSFASVALSIGYNLSQIGELLGHTNAATTKRYAYLVEEQKAAAANRTAEAIAARMLPNAENAA